MTLPVARPMLAPGCSAHPSAVVPGRARLVVGQGPALQDGDERQLWGERAQLQEVADRARLMLSDVQARAREHGRYLGPERTIPGRPA